jgi:sarcosine oxidase delta subunit
MSKIEYTKDDKVVNRQGEFYEIGSCYMTPRHIAKTTNEEWHYKADALVFFQLFADVDELTNKPRRFFDHMLSLVEYMRDNDPMLDVGNHREYWDSMIKGCEMWLSAVENGLYGEVEKLATKVTPTGANTGEKE